VVGVDGGEGVCGEEGGVKGLELRIVSFGKWSGIRGGMMCIMR
jgi:hypothetical protein